MPQTYIKLRQLTWLFLLFSLFNFLSSVAHAQTDSPPRGAGYVLGNKYYFTANKNEAEFNSCPVRRVTSKQVCSSSTVTASFSSPSGSHTTSCSASLCMPSSMVNNACRELGYSPSQCTFHSHNSSCNSYKTEYSLGSCMSIEQACSADSTLCSYIENHLNWFNQPPVAEDLEFSTRENISKSVTLIATDPDGPTPIVFEVFKQSENGVASIQGNTLTFMPNRDWFGPTTLTYRAQDNKGAWSEPSTVTITVTERKLVLGDTPAFTYDDRSRQGRIDIKGVDEQPISAIVYLENEVGEKVFTTETNKISVTSSSASFSYGLAKAPSGSYILKGLALDSIGHEYEFTYGEITIYTLKQLGFTYNPVTRKGQVSFEDIGNILSSAYIQLLNQSQEVSYQVTPACQKTSSVNTCSFDLNGAQEGEYEAKVELIDNFDFDFSTTNGPILIDKTPAVITHDLAQNGVVEYVSDIQFNVSDHYDPNVTIESITLTDDVSGQTLALNWKYEGDRVRLEHFSIFPSQQNAKNYHVQIKTIDHQLNKSDLTVDFTYQPKTFSKAQLNVPALLHLFQRADGSPAIKTEKIRLSSGDVIAGQHDVFAVLDHKAKYPVKINGITVEPGQTAVVSQNYNFTRENGVLKLSVEATAEEETLSQLLITVATPDTPIALFDLNFWTPAAKLDSNTWTFRQVIDPVDMTLRSTDNSLCSITASSQVARRADPFDKPTCLVEWNELPDEVTALAQNAGILGQVVKLGMQKIKYSLYIYNAKGEKVHVGNGENDVEVISAFDSMALDAIIPEGPLMKLVSEMDVRFRQSKGKACSLTLDENQAIRDSSMGIRANNPTCFFEWKELPLGVSQLDWARHPQANGIVPESGSHDFKWEVSIYSQKGTKVLLADQVKPIEIVDPPAPEITLESKYLLEDGKTLVIPINENYLGEVFIKGQKTNMDIEILRNNETLYDERIQAGLGYATNTIQRQLNEDRNDRALWRESVFSIKSKYELMPELASEKVFSVYSSPVTGAKPFISSPNEFALNTSSLPIHVDILNQFSHRDPYSVDRLGEWRVRVLRVLQGGEVVPVTDFTDMTDGHAEFDIDISDIDNVRTLRFTAEAELITDVEGFARVETSPRVLFLSLLRGDAIDGEITTRTLSGPAPLRGSFKIDLSDRELLTATGDIIWELSSDNGSTWEKHTPDERYKFIYNNEFDTGTYLLRAEITNKHSKATQYTEVIEIIAYDKPKLLVEGPTIRFVGDTAVFKATPGYDAVVDGKKVFEPIDLAGNVIEWSLDGGRTYTQEGDEIEISSDTQQRFMLAARVRTTTAPEDDKYSFNITKTSIEFKPIRAPRVRVTGSSIVEVGKEYTFEAVTSLPYPGMSDKILGYFTLPNGDQVSGPTLTYTPTDEDLTDGRMAISYNAWIENYENQGTEATHTLRTTIWKYIWPDFAMHYQANAKHAPALVTMTLRPMQAVGNRLEDVKYEWTLPEAIDLVDSSRGITRKFHVLEAGEHLVKVVITDARGNEAVVTYPLTLEAADPFILDLQLAPDNKEFREPLSLVVRPRISGGHPRDGFKSFEFTIDGQPIDSFNRYAKIDLEKGNYDIGVKMTSQMGVITEENIQVEVFENRIPICTVTQRESSTAIVFTADCTDPDGRMRSYDWQLGDRELVSGSKVITVGKHRLEGVSQVTLTGIDNSGGRSEPIIIPVSIGAEGESMTR